MIDTVNTEALLCVVRDIGSAVMAESGPQEVAGMVCSKFVSTFNAKGATLTILSPRCDRLNLELHQGDEYWYTDWPEAERIARAKELDLSSDSVLYLVVRDRTPEDWGQKEVPQCVLDLPFRFQDTLIGFIRLYFDRPVDFGPRTTNTLKIMVHQGACAIEKARLIERQRTEYDIIAASKDKLSTLGQLAAGVAHEINNPLAGILLFSTNLLKKAPPGSPFHEGLEVITEEVMRCKNIITELLEFSRAKEPTRLRIEFNNVIAKAVKIMENEYRLRHIALDTRLGEDLPDIIADPGQMEQVVINLLLNAAEAIGSGGRVVVESKVGPGDQSVCLTVTDNGCGIDAQHISSIFDPFFSTKAQGTGLGLAVIYGFIRSHRGTINVVSNAGKGTTFTITLPLGQKEITGSSDVRSQARTDLGH